MSVSDIPSEDAFSSGSEYQIYKDQTSTTDSVKRNKFTFGETTILSQKHLLQVETKVVKQVNSRRIRKIIEELEKAGNRISMGGSKSKQWDRSTKIDWTEKGADVLRDEIKAKVQAQTQRLNILVFGPTGCGKSSLCNGLKTSLDGIKDVSGYYAIGAGTGRSFTKKFQFDEWWGGVRLYDMAGVFESPDINSENIMNIMEGKVQFTGEMDDFLNPKSLESQPPRTNISCVVLVLKPGMELSENLKRIIGQIHRSVGEGSSLYHLVLTHLDTVDGCFEDPKKLNRVLRSERVRAATTQMSREVGTPLNAISFVRNYAVEKRSDVKSTVLFLHTFNQIVNAACDQERRRALMNQ